MPSIRRHLAFPQEDHTLNDLEIIGLAIIGGFIAARLFGTFSIPGVAGYVVIGVVLGPSVTNLFPQTSLDRLDVVADLALAVVALTIGGELLWDNLRRIAGSVVPIVLLESTGAMVAVTFGVVWISGNWPLALILGSISAATAPAATVMIIHEQRAAGVLTSTLLAVVGIDDAIALILFAVASAVAKALLADSAELPLNEVFLHAGGSIGGALAMGAVIGLVAAFAIRRISSREGVFTLALGSLILNAGLANHLHLSALLVNMTFGAVIANITPISSRSLFDQLSAFSPPLFAAFFVIAGAHLRLDLLPSLGLLGAIYLIARIAGKVSGAYLGAVLGQAPPEVRNNIGFGLLSQVGVAIGLSLVVAKEFGGEGAIGNDLAITVINVLLGTTIITEIVGPVLTRYGLRRSGEIGQSHSSEEEKP
jgi:Kef-type K+ transport system membrane component KefB